jgi:hypothetical protein
MAQLIDFIQLASTTHTYSGGNTAGNLSIDGDFVTYYGHSGGDYASGSGGSFGSTATPTSTHSFPTPVTIQSIIYQVYGTSSSGGGQNGTTLYVRVQYLVSGNPTWQDFTGTAITQSTSSSTLSYNPGTLTVTQTVANVTSVRVYVSNAGSYHNDFGQHTWDLRIYEIQAYGEGPAGYAFIM